MQAKNYPIKNWDKEDQPREKFLRKNPMDLSNAELLAILFTNGHIGISAVDLGQELMKTASNNLNNLFKLNAIDMMQIRGIGEAKAAIIMAAFELGRRRHALESFDRSIVTNSHDVANYMRTLLRDKYSEVFAVLYLSVSNRVKHFAIISEGGMTATIADPRLIIKKALEVNAINLILCHNHPSGSLEPSSADQLLTRKIREAAKLFDISVLDHLIVSEEGYFSFADQAML